MGGGAISSKVLLVMVMYSGDIVSGRAGDKGGQRRQMPRGPGPQGAGPKKLIKNKNLKFK